MLSDNYLPRCTVSTASVRNSLQLLCNTNTASLATAQFPATPIFTVSQITFLLNQLSWPIQSVSRNVYASCLCLCVCAIAETLLPGGLETSGQRGYCLYWHNIQQFSGFCCFNIFWGFDIFSGFWAFTNQPNVHNGGVSRRRVWSCGCWGVTCDSVTRDM